MSQQVTVAHVQQYATTITMLAQQKASRLMGAVQQKSGVTGRRVSFDQVGQVEAVELDTRHADTPIVETPHSRRWANLKPYVVNDLIDEEDVIRVLTDPQSVYARSQAAALGRKIDAILIAAMAAAADAGQEGGSTVSFDANMTVAVDYKEDGTTANSNLTLGKLRRAKALLDAQDVEDDDRHLGLTASQLHGLLRDTTITSADFNTVKALVNGEISTFLGFQFHRLERFAKVGTVRTIYAWHRDAIGHAIGRPLTPRVDVRPDKNYATQVYAKIDQGAVRIEEARIVSIACDESV